MPKPIYNPDDLATQAAEFAMSIHPINEGVQQEHVIAIVSWLSTTELKDLSPSTAAVIGRAYAMLAAKASLLS